MRKFLVNLFIVISLFLSSGVTSLAAEDSIESTTIETVYQNGDYIEIITKQSPHSLKSSTTTGSKTKNYKDKNGKIIWSFTVRGTFSYNGKTATCTSSSITAYSNDSNWRLSNKKATKSGSVAIASITAKKYTLLGICISTLNESATLKCSPSGKLS